MMKRTKVMRVLHGSLEGQRLVGIHGDRMETRKSHGVDWRVSMDGAVESILMDGWRDGWCSNRHSEGNQLR